MTAPPHATGALPDNPSGAFQFFLFNQMENPTQNTKTEKRPGGGGESTSKVEGDAEEVSDVKDLKQVTAGRVS